MKQKDKFDSDCKSNIMKIYIFQTQHTAMLTQFAASGGGTVVDRLQSGAAPAYSSTSQYPYNSLYRSGQQQGQQHTEVS